METKSKYHYLDEKGRPKVFVIDNNYYERANGQGQQVIIVGGKPYALHRTDGPAIECANGKNYYYFNGRTHRLDGPAYETEGIYYINGKSFDVKDEAYRKAYEKFVAEHPETKTNSIEAAGSTTESFSWGQILLAAGAASLLAGFAGQNTVRSDKVPVKQPHQNVKQRK